MPIFYHVDRTGSLNPGMVCNLENYIYASERLQPYIQRLFEGNLSKHGIQYLTQVKPIKLESQYIFVGGKLGIWNSDFPSGAIELLFEFVRKAYFPDKPSRFQSAFGWETLQAAIDFRSQFNNSQGTIWEIEAENYFRADMNLLDFGNVGLEGIDNAFNYWSGNSGFRPPKWEILIELPFTVIQNRES